MLWWSHWKESLLSLAKRHNFLWEISPADSHWRQGKVERRIGIIKRLVRVPIGESKLLPLEMQTVLFEAANLCNERPLGVNNKVQVDGAYIVLMTNCLLMGRATNGPITDAFMESLLKNSQRFGLVKSITKHFWDRLSVEVTPDWLLWRKWHKTGQNCPVLLRLHQEAEGRRLCQK